MYNLLGTESGPSDELYEKMLPTSWVLYEFNGEKDHGKFVAIHEKQTGLPKKEVLKTDKVSILHVVSISQRHAYIISTIVCS